MKLTARIELNASNPEAIPTGHQCNISNGDSAASCKIRLVGNAKLKLRPGESCDAELLISQQEEKYLGRLKPPTDVVIMNGLREIGKAKILKVSA